MATDKILERLDHLEAGQARLEAGQERLEARQARLEERQARFEARLDKLVIQHDDTRHALQLLAEAMAAMDQRIERRFEAMGARFDKLDAHLVKILPNHERRITRLEKRPRR